MTTKSLVAAWERGELLTASMVALGILLAILI